MGQPYGGFTYATGVNDSGQVVGEADSATQAHGYIYQNGAFTDLRPLAIRAANAINSVGQVAGRNTSAHAVLYSGGHATDLGTLGGATSTAYGINNSGAIVGESDVSGSLVTHAFLFTNGVMTDLGSLGGTYCAAGGINANGTMITGSGMTVPFQPGGPNNRHAFLYTNGNMQDLGTFGGMYSGAGSDPNSLGQFVGFADVPGNIDHAFLYTNNQMADLNSLVDGSAAGWTLSVGQGINDSGSVCGWGISPNGKTHAFLLTTVPEPPVVGLIAAVLCMARRGQVLHRATKRDGILFRVGGTWLGQTVDATTVLARAAYAGDANLNETG